MVETDRLDAPCTEQGDCLRGRPNKNPAVVRRFALVIEIDLHATKSTKIGPAPGRVAVRRSVPARANSQLGM